MGGRQSCRASRWQSSWASHWRTGAHGQAVRLATDSSLWAWQHRRSAEAVEAEAHKKQEEETRAKENAKEAAAARLVQEFKDLLAKQPKGFEARGKALMPQLQLTREDILNWQDDLETSFTISQLTYVAK